MSENEKSYSAKINDQIRLVLSLANDLKRNVFSKAVMTSENLEEEKARFQAYQIFPSHGKLSSRVNSSWEFVYDSDDDEEIDSFALECQEDIDFSRKSFAEIIGHSQYDCNQESENSTIILEKDEKNLPDFSLKTEGFVRGPYRSYRLEEKLKAVRLYKEGRNYAFISRFLNIPQKNIVRWCKNGVHRKEGAGRKIGDMEMERNVLKWIGQYFKEGEEINQKEIRLKAMSMSTKSEFKSSKGWLKNFIRRHGLNRKYDIL